MYICLSRYTYIYIYIYIYVVYPATRIYIYIYIYKDCPRLSIGSYPNLTRESGHARACT